MSAVIEFDRVSKEYRLGAGATDLREGLASFVRRWTPGVKVQQSANSSFWALRDVSFAVERGQALGIIGPNGAGKTTVLKLLSTITRPSSGHVRVTGRLSSLIELGAGFHPDLSGRENVYLNGVILGLKKRELDALFDDIVEFAGLARFIDTPVKRYSSGMYARLGFAVAAHVNPDVLLVDEVLSVGDVAFQNRCADRMRQLRERGTTIVFISHNMHAMLGLCDACLVLAEGRIEFAGATHEAVRCYQQLNQAARDRHQASKGQGGGELDVSRPVDILKVDVLDELGERRETFEMGDTVVVRIEYDAHLPIEAPLFSAGLVRSDGLNACSNTARGQYEPEVMYGPGVVDLVIPNLQLIPDTYSVVTSICERDSLRQYASEQLASFRVTSPHRYIDHHYGVFLPDFRWRRPPTDHAELVGPATAAAFD
jgi:lipopolysaccharide transport system ATP-binding protein